MPVHSDAAFHQLVIAVNSGVPIVLMAWDASRHELAGYAVHTMLRTTGTAGFLFLLLSLAVAPLRKLTGWSRVIAVQRVLGLYAYFFLFVHMCVFCVFERETMRSSAMPPLHLRGTVEVGAMSLVLLLPLAITSSDAMVARLGPRRWRSLHRLGYVAAALGALHQYLAVNGDFQQSLVLVGLLALLLAYRVLQHFRESRNSRRNSAPTASPVLSEDSVHARR